MMIHSKLHIMWFYHVTHLRNKCCVQRKQQKNKIFFFFFPFKKDEVFFCFFPSEMQQGDEVSIGTLIVFNPDLSWIVTVSPERIVVVVHSGNFYFFILAKQQTAVLQQLESNKSNEIIHEDHLRGLQGDSWRELNGWKNKINFDMVLAIYIYYVLAPKRKMWSWPHVATLTHIVYQSEICPWNWLFFQHTSNIRDRL